jgi:trans-L-3-hydroxyproline dehydratase
MFEPRGHYDMYGVLLVEPDLPGADLAVLFIHNEGYSTMCGHAVIALGRWAVESGRVTRTGGESKVAIQCPCGLVEARVAGDGSVKFTSVPAFAFALDSAIDVPGLGALPSISATAALSMLSFRQRVSVSTSGARPPAIWWTRPTR